MFYFISINKQLYSFNIENHFFKWVKPLKVAFSESGDQQFWNAGLSDAELCCTIYLA